MTESSDPPAHREWRRPFHRLVRHATGRIIHGGEGSDSDGLDLSLGVVLGLLALPGIFASLFLIDKYGSLFQVLRGDLNFDPYAASLPDEYFFVVVSMAVSASVAVWKWDAVLPDRRDYNNLAPLPIGRRAFFFANLVALLVVAVVLSVDVNGASTVLFPVVVSGSRSSFLYFLRFLGAHFFSVALASIFGFVSVISVLGTLMAMLPIRTFRRISLLVRIAIIVAMMAALSTSFAIPRLIDGTSVKFAGAIRAIPPVWFVGLSQSLLGRGNAFFKTARNAGLIVTGGLLICANATYALSYRRYYLRSVEGASGPSHSGGTISRMMFGVADRALVRSPFQRAAFRFTFRALARGPNQSLAFGWFAGLGVVVAAQTLFGGTRAAAHNIESIPSAELLSVPLILAYFVILGIRSALDIPANLRANWLFRISVNPDSNECVPLARKVVFTILGPLLTLFCFPLYAHFWGWKIALVHTAIVFLMCVSLTEILLAGFHKVPFTCALPPFKSGAIVQVLLYTAGFFVFTELPSAAEHWAFGETFGFVVFAVLFAGEWFALRAWRKELTFLDRRVVFEDKTSPAVESMHLSYGP